MSKKQRHTNDNYPTPANLALEGWKLAQQYSFRQDKILEPGCGDNQPFLVHALGEKCRSWRGCDVRDVKAVDDRIVVLQGDFLEGDPIGRYESFDVIIANPPFVQAAEFAQKSISLLSDLGCAVFLCRQSFHTRTKTRDEFWEDNPPIHVSTISPRPSFTGDGKTDGAEYAFYVWAPWIARSRMACGGMYTTLGWTAWDKPKRSMQA
jgi:hypothetical protein